ncbi:hypothetical protein HDU96_010012 [Phlyctochytrium bullatum]|nr:hypothetical protein HDU96_010012 [Phlyctochytrium bullatum]
MSEKQILCKSTMPPTILPTLSTPTIGQPSFPNELLRCILLHVLPKDLPTVAAANRHLRAAVVACIDSNLAQHHISPTSSRERKSSSREYQSPKPADGPPEYHLVRIPFNHPLLRFHHSVAALCHHGINDHIASQMWGLNSAYQVWEGFFHSRISCEARAFCAERVQALRAAVQIRFRRPKPNNVSSILDEEINDLAEAMNMALLMNSVELLQDIHGAIPEAISGDPESDTMKSYFHTCAKMGFLEGLELVPSNHSLLNSPRGFLHSAYYGRNLAAMQRVLEKGALLNQTVARSLWFTFEEGEPVFECLQLLLKYGFNPNWAFLGNPGNTALESFTTDEAYECMKLLLDHGADPNFRDNREKTALDYIAFNREAKCKSLLLLIKAGANIDEICPPWGGPALSVACLPGGVNWEVIETLLDAGASLNVSCRLPPLHAAVRQGKKDLVKRFLNAGALVNFPNEYGRTPLHFALHDREMFKEVEIPLLLLEAGADPTIRCGRNCTPLDGLEPDDEDIEWCAETLRLFDALVEHGAALDKGWKKALAEAKRVVR